MSLLTIQYRDIYNALHGAVFLMAKNEAIRAQQQLASQPLLSPASLSPAPCEPQPSPAANSIKMATVRTMGDAVPDEYRVLVYEQLLRQLHGEDTFSSIYRDGDIRPGAVCTGYTLALTITAFKKGNAVVRASTGPLGFFMATTSLKFHVQVQGTNGKVLLDSDVHATERGDSDSLNVTGKIAKSLNKQLEKATKRNHAS